MDAERDPHGASEPSSKCLRVFEPGEVSSGEEDDASAAATGSAVAVARAAQRRALVANLRRSLSEAAQTVGALQKQWASQLESVDGAAPRRSLSAPTAAFWNKKRRLALVRHLNAFGLPPSTETQWWDRLCRSFEVPDSLRPDCPDVAADVVRLAHSARDDSRPTPDGKRVRAGPGGLFTANSAKAFLERIDALEVLRGTFSDATSDGPLARAVAASVPIHSCPPSRVKLLGMPAWWVIGQHDVALVQGVLRHGWGNLAEMAADEKLPFAKLAPPTTANDGDEDEEESDGEGGEGGGAQTITRPSPGASKTLRPPARPSSTSCRTPAEAARVWHSSMDAIKNADNSTHTLTTSTRAPGAFTG